MQGDRVDGRAALERRIGELTSDRSSVLLRAVGLGFVIITLWYFHDRTWWPPDDGVYAYVAQRILAGDVLNGNLRDLHAGYVNFVHAAALWLFGEDVVTLRYPLALLTLMQSALAFRLLRDRGALPSAVGAAASGVLSFVLFVNPSANWYAQAIAFAAVALLAGTSPGGARRELALGALVMTAFLFRQLSGVFLAIGVLTWLLLEPRSTGAGGKLVGRLLALIMAVGLAGYVWGKGSVGGGLMLGLCPFLLTLAAIARTEVGNRDALAMIGRLALGGVAAVAPLLAYHLVHGSLSGWIGDAFLLALHVNTLDFVDQSRFWHLAALAARALFRATDPAAILNALFWLALLAAPLALGIGVAAAALRGRTLHPLPVVASIFALNSLHYEIWIYLVFTSALCVVALLWMLGASRRGRIAGGSAALLLVAVGLAYQAGQPVTRSVTDVIAGKRVQLDAPDGLPGARLAMAHEDQETYLRLLQIIQTNAQPGEAILALPFQPELYFLSQHRSIFDFYVTTLAIRDDRQLAVAMERLKAAAPPIVIHRPADKYNNWASEALLAEIKRRYRRAEPIGSFDVYLPAPAPAP